MPTAAPASTAALAQELVSLCRAGKYLDAVARLYSKDIVSVEPIDSPQKPAEMRGIDAIRGKNERWVENNEIHKAEAIGPFVGEDQFAVRYDFAFTAKQSGQRMQMSEMGLYTVKDGKIVREQFFYHMPGAWRGVAAMLVSGRRSGPTLCLTGPASQFLSLFLTPLQHPMSPWPPPSACGFHWSRQGCLRHRGGRNIGA